MLELSDLCLVHSLPQIRSWHVALAVAVPLDDFLMFGHRKTGWTRVSEAWIEL